jgi:membrane protease YdiL (CAAX protease family)
MPIPEPNPNGEPPSEHDEFEMQLEPVDRRELNISEAPMVEDVRPRRKRGFGFWMAGVWCIVFLTATQAIPSFILTAVYGVAITERMKIIIDEAKDDPRKRVDFEWTLKKLLESPEMKRMTQIALIAAPACGILFSLLIIPRVVGKEWRRRLALRRPHLEHVVLILLLLFPVFVFNIAFETATSRLPKWVDNFNLPGMKEVIESMMTWPAWIVVLGIAVGPALSEELFCRGFLGHGLCRRFGNRLGIVVTSFFFGLIHLSLIQSIFAVGMGLLLHSLYLATRSLYAPILLHFLNNFFAVPTETEKIPFPLGTSLQHSFEMNPWPMLLAATLMITAIGWAFWTSRVRIFSPDGREQHYLHVALPPEDSSDRAQMGPIRLVTLGMLLVTTAVFGAVWFGI